MQEAKTCKLLSYASWVAHLAEKPPQPLLSGGMGFSDIVPPDFSTMVAYSELYGGMILTLSPIYSVFHQNKK